MLGVFEFAALHDVFRVGIRGDDFVFFQARVSAAVIEMQVRVDDDIDFAAGPGRGPQAWSFRYGPSTA